MIRTLALGCMAASICAPAFGQVASVSVFGPMPAPVIDETDGARRSTASDFALYELGRWRDRQASSPSPGGAPSNAVFMPRDFPSAAVHQIASACGASADAPPRQLSIRTTLGRRVYWPLIANAECRYGLPPGLMDSVVLAESRYDPEIVSPAGAAGLAQLMPGTATDLGVADRFDPSASVQAGARYLRQLLDSFGGNVPLALAAYNAGPTAVRRVRGIPVNGETPGYVQKVLDYWTAPGIGPMSPILTARQTAQMLGFAPVSTN